MTRSMTGFASLKGQLGDHSWVWDIRGVNARGLDFRLRLPDWIAGLEAAARKAGAAEIGRGSVNLSLKMTREAHESTQAINPAGLEHALAMLSEINHQAGTHGLNLATPSAVDIAAMRGVVETAQTEDDSAPLLAALRAQLPTLLAEFNQMRAHEGAALNAVLIAQLDQMAQLVTKAQTAADARKDAQRTALRTNLARVMENTDGADSDRVAQELALIAVKSDIREEIDRLEAHVVATRDLLQSDTLQGRKLDFLMQEFMREANTLCSKSQYSDLTQIGLDLKLVIDQMREQVQNVE